MRELIKKTEEQKQIDRLYDTLTAYQKSRQPLDLTESEVKLLKIALITREAAQDLIGRMADDGK